MSRPFANFQIKFGLLGSVALLLHHWGALTWASASDQNFAADDCTTIAANGACNCTYSASEAAVIYCSNIYATAGIRITVLNDKDVEIVCQGRIGIGYNTTHPFISTDLLALLPRLGRMRKADFLSVRYCFPFVEILTQLALYESNNLQVHGLEFLSQLEWRHIGNNLSHLRTTVKSLELLAQNLQHLHSEESLALLAQIPPDAMPRTQRLGVDLLGAFPHIRYLAIDMNFDMLPVEIFTPVALTLSELYLLGRLSRFPREALSKLPILTHLTMLGHQLAARLQGDDFTTLVTLKQLYLRGCAITTLPTNIFFPLTALTHLSLTQNQLRVLPAKLLAQNHQLQMLDLNENQLEILPSGLFAATTALQGIYLTSNRLRKLSADLLPPHIELTTLYADLNELRVVEAGALTNARHLRHLILKHNKLEWSRTEACDVFEGLHSLQVIALQNNSLNFVCDQLGAANHSASALYSFDLRDNNLTHISAQLLRRINSSKSLRYIYLANNPWVCDCSAQQLHTFARRNRLRFPEVKDIICNKPKQTPLFQLAYYDFCLLDLGVSAKLVITFGCVSALSLFVIIFALCYYKNKLSLKIWLYAHGLCLRCISEVELDRDRKYDAFISYTHHDEHFVEHELLPGLEQGAPSYKICIHVRDWLVGAFISEQIINSVEQSRRTIIVLSQNFIHSEWARMEFRMAHQCALNEGRTRVILVIYGDLKNTELLDQELSAYLKMNTYLKWGEPWFWEKLRYAMPHSRRVWERQERAKRRAAETAQQVMTTRI